MPRIIKGLLVAATLAYGAADANAAGRYAKKEAEVTAAQTELTKPMAKAATDEPNLRQKAFLPGSMDPIKVVTDGQIRLMEKLNAMTRDNDPEKPDLMFRLGQLYEEQARYYNFRAREMDEEIFQATANLSSI